MKPRAQPSRRQLVLASAAGLAAPLAVPLGAGWPLAAAAQTAQAGRAGQAAASPLGIETFFENPNFTGAELSPDGLRVAVTVGSKTERDALVMVDLATMKAQPVAAVEATDIVGCRWISDRRLVLFGGDRRSDPVERWRHSQLYAVNADGSEFRRLGQSYSLQPDAAQLAQDGDGLFVVNWEALDFGNLLRIDTMTPSRTPESFDTPPYAVAWLTDAEGRLRGVTTARGDRTALHGRDVTTGAWRKLREADRFEGGLPVPLAVLADGRWLVLALLPGRDTTALCRYDPTADRIEEPALVALAGFDVQPQRLWFRAGRLLGLHALADAEVGIWFDERMKTVQAEIDRRLPATANLVHPPRRGDSPFVLVRSFADAQSPLYQVYDTASKKLTRLGEERPGQRPEAMGTADLVRYKARDGLEIPAYLTLPAGGAKKNLPLVVLVHGGPWARDAGWGWHAEVQFLASRGYAVLQPQFRGSTGFGQRHFKAGQRQWGLAMQDDVADGARWAIAQGIADARRVAIAGGSYGGYAALMGLVNDGDLFRCAVSWAAPADLDLIFRDNWDDLPPEHRRLFFPRWVGDREKDAAQLRAANPVLRAANLRNPLLLAYGTLDRRVPIEHGKRLRDALKGHNTQVEWVEYDKEGHGWALPATQVDFWGRVERFLARHLSA